MGKKKRKKSMEYANFVAKIRIYLAKVQIILFDMLDDKIISKYIFGK